MDIEEQAKISCNSMTKLGITIVLYSSNAKFVMLLQVYSGAANSVTTIRFRFLASMGKHV